MSEERTLLLLARFGREERRALLAEAAAAACELQSVDSLEAAVLALAAHPPPAVLVDLALDDAEKLCRKIRTRRRAVDVAIFGLTSTVTETAFARALSWGVDDVVSPRIEGALATRLVSLPLDPTVPVTERGDAVVATRDESENLIGRMLTNAGYQVEYATDSTSLLHLAASERMRLVVASPDLGSPRDHVTTTRRRGGNATWIVLGRPAEVARLEREVADLPRVGVVSLTDALDHILFVSNELAVGDGRGERRERRILHGALCAFCPLGSTMLEHGFTYNVSPSGLYVRTLAPPREDRVRIDVLAPGTEQPVRLEGQIAWRRGFGRLGTATAPPGFGVRLVGGEVDDRTTWARACTALLVNRAAPAKPRAAGSVPPAAPAAAPPRPRGATLLGMGAREGAIPAPPAAPATPKPPATSPTPPGPPVVTSGARAASATPAGPPVAVAAPAAPADPPVTATAPATPAPAATPAAAVPPDPAPPTPDPVASPPLPDASDTPTPIVPPPAAVLTAAPDAEAAGDGGEGANQRPPVAPSAPARQGDGETAAHAPQRVPVPSDLPVRRESQRPSHESGRSERVGATRNPAAARAASHPPRGRARGGGRRAAHAAASRASSAPARPRAAVPRSVLFGLLLGGLAVLATVVLVSWWSARVPEPAPRLPPVPPEPAAPPVSAAAPPTGGVATGAPRSAPSPADATTAPSAATPAPPPDTSAAPAPSGSGAATSTADATAPAPSSAPEPPATAPAGPVITHEPASDLLHYEALLEVFTATPTQVFSNGILVGPTGQPHKVRCGLRFVRLGDAPGAWRSEGVTVDVACGRLTRIRMATSP